jgi:hypothetical protein
MKPPKPLKKKVTISAQKSNPEKQKNITRVNTRSFSSSTGAREYEKNIVTSKGWMGKPIYSKNIARGTNDDLPSGKYNVVRGGTLPGGKYAKKAGVVGPKNIEYNQQYGEYMRASKTRNKGIAGSKKASSVPKGGRRGVK